MVPGSVVNETIPGAGSMAPSLILDGDTVKAGPVGPTDIRIARHRVVLAVGPPTAAPTAWHGMDMTAADLTPTHPPTSGDALVRAWRGTGLPGGPSEQDARIALIVATAAEMGAPPVGIA